MGSFAYRWFFILFYFIAQTVALNVLIAFIIDMFVNQMDEINKKEKADTPTISNNLNKEINQTKIPQEEEEKVEEEEEKEEKKFEESKSI